MSVICDVCHTENREHAMFCRGCASKLPAFAPTGSSALEAMHALQSNGVRAARIAGAEPSATLPVAASARTFWIRFCLLMLGLFVGFVVWYAYVIRTQPAPPTAKVAPTPLAAVGSSSRTDARTSAATPSSAEAAGTTRALAASDPVIEPLLPVPEPVQPAGTTTSESREAPAPLAPRAASEPALQQPQPQSTPTHRDAKVTEPADPRPACASLYFIFRARCEAAQCAKPAYTRHSYCDSVRAQTRRDVARRDLMQD